MTYASETSVSVAKSKAEIEDLLQRAGGTKFGVLTDDDKASVLFQLQDRRIMFEVALPAREAFATRKVRGRTVKNSPEQQQREWEQACRSRWRALALAIKAKLVTVESGIETLEEAFLAHIVVPSDGRSRRFADVAIAAIARAYSSPDGLPPLLPSGGAS